MAHALTSNNMIKILLSSFLAVAVFYSSVSACHDNYKSLYEPVLMIWKNSNAPISVRTPSEQLFYQAGGKLTSPVDGRTYILRDKDSILAKGIFHCATGMPFTIHVSTIIPGLIVGMVDFEGNLIKTDLEVYENGISR